MVNFVRIIAAFMTEQQNVKNNRDRRRMQVEVMEYTLRARVQRLQLRDLAGVECLHVQMLEQKLLMKTGKVK